MSKNLIALLGQPNAGKSTLFNGLTGSKQHVGNWPGKTVERKEGQFSYKGQDYTIVDLPGSYSLSASSDEEIITRQYIAGGESELTCILIDSSQLERSLYMLADYVGIQRKAIVVLNMIDVSRAQGKVIDTELLSQRLGVPVIPFNAADLKNYQSFYEALEDGAIVIEEDLIEKQKQVNGEKYQRLAEALSESDFKPYSHNWIITKVIEGDEEIVDLVKATLTTKQWQSLESDIDDGLEGTLKTGEAKFKWIEDLVSGVVTYPETREFKRSRFDRLATHNTWGKPLAVFIILLGLMLSYVPAFPFMQAGEWIYTNGVAYVTATLYAAGVSSFIAGLVGVLISSIGFSLSMAGFVVGVAFIFGLMEDVGYMARVSYVFDDTMSQLGLQGKSIMPILLSFGCTIGGASGSRVIDSWGQKVLTMALAWAIPCAGTWGVVGFMSGVFFDIYTPLVIASLFFVAIVHIVITSKVFVSSLVRSDERHGLIMELPPYHKPKWGNIFQFVANRFNEILVRALRVIILVSIIFYFLSYSPDGNVDNSLIYRVGVIIEPVTRIFGMTWQLFMAFIASFMGKEAALGVLSSLYSSGASVMESTFSRGDISSQLGNVLTTQVGKAQALAFIYAFTFNVPCVMAVSSTYQETHSFSWTLKLTLYYVATAFFYAFLVYRVGLLFWGS